MNMQSAAPVYVMAATRSAIGTFGGSLKDTTPADLGTAIARAAIDASRITPDTIGHAVIGHVIHTEPRDMYLARRIALGAGLPEAAPAFGVNRLCGSGLQAIVSTAQMIAAGDCDAALAGGVEVMSRAPHSLPAMRFGARLGEAMAEDMLLGALTDPFGAGHMGMTAENIADEYGISRKAQDAFALRSQQRAAAAIAAGHFNDQITPVEIRRKGEKIPFARDEHPRKDADMQSLQSLAPVFRKGGSVTAGNASGINDGAGMLVLAGEAAARQSGLAPLARIAGYGFGGVAPRLMGMGPVPATQAALAATGLDIADLAVVESNEAFAAQACAVSRELGLADDVVNPNGGAIALGHPIGATGAIIMTKLLYELRRRDARYGMATMCVGGGQGISVIIDTKA